MDASSKPLRWDIVAGLVIIALAVGFLVIGLRLDFGTLRHMGPGFVPVAASFMLGALGVIILIEGLAMAPRSIELPKLRPFLVVVACPLVFGALIPWAGLVPTVIATALVARMAEPLKWGWELVIVPLCLAAASVLVFIQFIGIAIPTFF